MKIECDDFVYRMTSYMHSMIVSSVPTFALAKGGGDKLSLCPGPADVAHTVAYIAMLCCMPLSANYLQDKMMAWRVPGFCGPAPQLHRCLVPDKVRRTS
jgi:hypothetical protein